MAHNASSICAQTADKASNTEYGISYYKTSEKKNKIKPEHVWIDENSKKKGMKNKCECFTR